MLWICLGLANGTCTGAGLLTSILCFAIPLAITVFIVALSWNWAVNVKTRKWESWGDE